MSEAAAIDPPVGAQAFESTRRRLTPRQAEVVMQLVRATEAEVEQVGYAGLTVRSVARRAGVAPATAYNYFSSKDHLLTEVLWLRMLGLPTVVFIRTQPLHERIRDTVRAMVLFATESPALVDACTAALLSPNPDVRHLRDRIGTQTSRRLAAALGPGVDPMVVRVLETTYSGALLTAGIGHMSFMDIPDFIAEAAELMVGDRSAGPGGDGEPGVTR